MITLRNNTKSYLIWSFILNEENDNFTPSSFKSKIINQVHIQVSQNRHVCKSLKYEIGNLDHFQSFCIAKILGHYGSVLCRSLLFIRILIVCITHSSRKRTLNKFVYCIYAVVTDGLRHYHSNSIKNTFLSYFPPQKMNSFINEVRQINESGYLPRIVVLTLKKSGVNSAKNCHV